MARTAACRLCGKSFEARGRRVYCERCTAKADRDVASSIDAKCKECGGKFSTKNPIVRYCSDKCRIDGTRRLKREHARLYMADPEKRAIKRARERAWAANRRRAMEGKGPAGSSSGGGRQRDDHAAGRPPRPRSRAKQRACEVCGRSFVPHGGTSRANCERCAARFDGEISTVRNVKCKECGKEFSTKNRSARYCSTKCSAEAIRRRMREYARGRMADPEQRAILSARARARQAAHRAGKKGERQK